MIRGLPASVPARGLDPWRRPKGSWALGTRMVMPRHALSARAVEEMWRYIALVGTLISMHGFNSLKCSVTPYFLLIDHFLCRLSMFLEKLKKTCIVEV